MLQYLRRATEYTLGADEEEPVAERNTPLERHPDWKRTTAMLVAGGLPGHGRARSLQYHRMEETMVCY